MSATTILDTATQSEMDGAGFVHAARGEFLFGRGHSRDDHAHPLGG